MTRFCWLSAVMCVLGVSMTPKAYADHYVVCESVNNKRVFCDVRDGYDADIRISRQFSSSSCIEDISWGRDRRGVWVDDGCRAEFAVESRHGYDRDEIDEAREERYRLEREVERTRELRAETARERPQQQPAAAPREHCPSGFEPGNHRCSNEERRRGCKDMKMPGGTTCNSRGWGR